MSGVGDPPRVYRGSRKHVLDWVESPGFLDDLQSMVTPVRVTLRRPVTVFPRGYAAPREARLDQATPELAVAHAVRDELRDWWLQHHRGANTPNWDLVVACEIENRPGLVLFEAKANLPELKTDPKPLKVNASDNSKRNHRRISAAIAEANTALRKHGWSTNISIDSHYQLADRVAFMWKLATLGIPTVVMYLGFIGDEGIRDAGPPFASVDDWREAFHEHAKGVIPDEMVGTRLELGAAPAWLLVRGRPILSPSPPAR